MMADPSNPYAKAEMQMMERIEAAYGANPSETWTRKMIEHHRGAIAMSDLLLAQGGGDPRILEKARMTADMQRREISELEALLPAGVGGSGGEAESPFAQAVGAMHQQMMAVSGATPAETWVRKMIVHHRGGAAMSDVLLALGGDPEVLEKARMTRQKQLQEAEDLERLLRGEEAPAAASSPDARPAPAPAEVPQPATQPKAVSKAPEASKESAADPHAGHDMSNMSH
ncbi:DUF305 domain-containing protein [Sphingosinithalassobacter sp. CS137]|uniref:DUF305 domain-containing protein n=1 Tax=Sphingosinithalassobacter sp. CS137 TaxID=2762748 RepID=UPI0021D02EAD|nr:DUF305 domain-containing protein [Sphingosinithalassobacter sp. CS137]